LKSVPDFTLTGSEIDQGTPAPFPAIESNKTRVAPIPMEQRGAPFLTLMSSLGSCFPFHNIVRLDGTEALFESSIQALSIHPVVDFPMTVWTDRTNPAGMIGRAI